jgi:hypothetical protein
MVLAPANKSDGIVVSGKNLFFDRRSAVEQNGLAARESEHMNPEAWPNVRLGAQLKSGAKPLGIRLAAEPISARSPCCRAYWCR